MTWTPFGLYQRLISAGSPESPKALLLIQSGTGMLIIALTLTVVSAIRIAKTGDLGSGAVTTLLGSLGFLAGLAGLHRQADPGAAIPGHSETNDSTTVNGEISRTASATSVTDPVPAVRAAAPSAPGGGTVTGCADAALPTNGSNQ